MIKTNHLKSLILFDLDGTLIDVFEFHLAGFDKVIREVWNIPDRLPKQERYGIPQRETLRRVCEASGVEQLVIDHHLPAAMNMLTSEMRQALPNDLVDRLLPGAYDLLERLDIIAGVHLVLATGTLGPTAEIILERSGLRDFFPIGAYGHECDSREELIKLALSRGIDHYGLNPDEARITTIGDAPSDIRAGKSIDAFTVSVATSSFTIEELAMLEPDVLFENLENTDMVVQGMLPANLVDQDLL